jgi:hypothetical protein
MLPRIKPQQAQLNLSRKHFEDPKGQGGSNTYSGKSKIKLIAWNLSTSSITYPHNRKQSIFFSFKLFFLFEDLFHLMLHGPGFTAGLWTLAVIDLFVGSY